MSKEKHEAWRSMRANTMAETAPRVTAAPEDAMHQIWSSERRELINGKWYIPISEVSEILTAPAESPDPLSEEWQASIFPNLRIGKPTPEEDSKRWFAESDRKQRGR